jgi:hypothetical protein
VSELRAEGGNKRLAKMEQKRIYNLCRLPNTMKETKS